MRFVLPGWIVLIFGLAGCVGPQLSDRAADHATPQDRIVRTHIEFVDDACRPLFPDGAGQAARASGASLPDRTWFNFHPVPGPISRDIEAGDGVYGYDLRLDTAGLHWLQVGRTGERTALVSAKAPVSEVAVYVRIGELVPSR